MAEMTSLQIFCNGAERGTST